MKNKSFLNKLNALKPPAPIHREVERKLLPRLKWMAYLMYALSLGSLVFAAAVPTVEKNNLWNTPHVLAPTEIEAAAAFLFPEESELDPTEVLNFYAVSMIFATIGTLLLWISWKKKKVLLQESEVLEE